MTFEEPSTTYSTLFAVMNTLDFLLLAWRISTGWLLRRQLQGQQHPITKNAPLSAGRITGTNI